MGITMLFLLFTCVSAQPIPFVFGTLSIADNVEPFSEMKQQAIPSKETIIENEVFPNLNGEEFLQQIQDDHFEIIKIENLLAKKLTQLSKKLEKAIESNDITLEDAKKVLGWREVQTLFKHQYEKEKDRSDWVWEGSWGAKTRRLLNGGPHQWFEGVRKMM